MAANLKQTPPSLALETWGEIPEKHRNIAALNKQLGELGYKPVARASLYRWRNKSGPPVKQSVRSPIKHEPARVPETIVVHAIEHPAPLPRITTEDLNGVPTDLVEALGLRVLLAAKGDGLDRVEDAIVKVAAAIAEQAPEIAKQLLATERETETVEKDGETVKSKTVEAANAAKNAIGALSTLADAMHRIAAARTLPSLAHRNYAEGDRLMGEGRKYDAEAETMRNAARADNARVINPDVVGRGYEDVDEEDEALAALRDVEKIK